MTRMNGWRRAGVLLPIALWWISSPVAESCTLWAAVGEAVRDGGSLVVKNRDWRPDHRQEIKRVTPKQGFRYYGLFAHGNDDPGLKAGVNEKGLVVVSATAPYRQRDLKEMPRAKDRLGRLLREHATVEEALSRQDLFLGPTFFLVADRRQAAVIEVGPGGTFAIGKAVGGTVAHTNHYVLPAMVRFNPAKIGESSRERSARIHELLGTGAPFGPADFERFSASRDGGPDRAIWRTGTSADATRTLATWMVHQHADGDITLFVRLANPGEAVREIRLSGADLFGR
jgi:isopenicillin-N N-acyltransferase like protein